MTHSFPTQRSSNLSWKVGVDFKPVAGSLFYANVTKGYKAGSFPTIGAATVSQYRPVVQESVITYEAGFKQELFDRSVLLTGDRKSTRLNSSHYGAARMPASACTKQIYII